MVLPAIGSFNQKDLILFLYSLKNLTNGTKPGIKAVLAPFYGWYKLVMRQLKKLITNKTII
jgi:hypothetical protein